MGRNRVITVWRKFCQGLDRKEPNWRATDSEKPRSGCLSWVGIHIWVKLWRQSTGPRLDQRMMSLWQTTSWQGCVSNEVWDELKPIGTIYNAHIRCSGDKSVPRISVLDVLFFTGSRWGCFALSLSDVFNKLSGLNFLVLSNMPYAHILFISSCLIAMKK